MFHLIKFKIFILLDFFFPEVKEVNKWHNILELNEKKDKHVSPSYITVPPDKEV